MKQPRKWTNQADLLLFARIKAKLTQAEMAHKLYCKEQQYSAWERGVYPVPARHIHQVCYFLSIEPSSLSMEMSRDYQRILFQNAVK